jgi:DNA-binding GntR family transcriptional regulator
MEFARSDTVAPPLKTLVDAAFEHLREDILSGRLAPGAKLRVENLRARYGIGSSTLREALSRLVSDTLVTVEGQRGFTVALVSLDDFRQISAMRKLLETTALAESIACGDDDWEAGIVGAFHHLGKIEERIQRAKTATDGQEDLTAEWERRNRAFHRALIAACDNRWLLLFRSILLDHAGRYLRLSLTDRTIPRDGHAEHQAIMDAVLARDTDRACRLTEEHIDRTVGIVSEMTRRW